MRYVFLGNKKRHPKPSRTSLESESEVTDVPSQDAIKDLEQQRRMLEKENEERKAKLKKLKEEEKAAKEALNKGTHRHTPYMCICFNSTVHVTKYMYVTCLVVNDIKALYEACACVNFKTEFGKQEGDKKTRKRRLSTGKPEEDSKCELCTCIDSHCFSLLLSDGCSLCVCVQQTSSI